MKTTLITLAVVLCAIINGSQARLWEFSNMFHDFFSPMPSLQNTFQTVCDADQHACIQKGGTSLVMSSEQSTTSTYYDLCTGSPQYVDGEEIPQVEVRDRQKQLICVIQPGVYVVNGKNLKALDLRKYTMGNFVLKAKTPCDTAILTYYSGFQMDSDNTLDNFY